MIYSIEKINKIEREKAYAFRLDERTIEYFHQMVQEIGAPIKQVKVGGSTATEWETIRKPRLSQQQPQQSSNKKTPTPAKTFKTSTASASVVPDLARKDDKAILSENIDEMRILLNKMTPKTYKDSLEAMIKRLNAFQRYHSVGLLDDTMLMKMSETIFAIATQNRFYSKLYADLFSELVTTFEFLRVMFTNYAAKVIDEFLNVGEYVPEENYDLFCKMNEANDQRKSVA